MFSNVFHFIRLYVLVEAQTMVRAKLDYRLGKKVLCAIGSTELLAISKTPIASLALEATYGAGSITAARAFMELSRLQKEIRKAPFDRELHQQLARVLALFGADYPINQVLDKRMLRLAKKEELRSGPRARVSV
jgi:hypothetical protein